MTGKKIFKTHAGAMARAAEIMGSGECNASLFRAYQCQYCGGYHLSSKADYKDPNACLTMGTDGGIVGRDS